MKGIENITSRILQEADDEVQEINRRSAAQVDNITVSYDALCKDAREKIMAEAEAKAQEQDNRQKGSIALEHRKNVLQEKQNMVDEAFKAAQEKLVNYPADQQIEFLSSLAAKNAVGGEKLVLNEKDRAAFGEALVSKANEKLNQAGKSAVITLAEETRPVSGGFILASGDIEQNCTYEVLLRGIREDMAMEVSKILFN